MQCDLEFGSFQHTEEFWWKCQIVQSQFQDSFAIIFDAIDLQSTSCVISVERSRKTGCIQKLAADPFFHWKKKSFQKIFIPIILGIHFWDINHIGRMAIRYSLITIFFSLQVFVIINNIVLLQHVWRSLMFVNWLFVQIRFNVVLDDNYCRNDKISLTFAFLYSKLVSHCFRKLLNSSEFVKEKLKIDRRTWL